MHLAIDVAFDVVDHIMHEVLFQSVVANPLVGVDRRVAADFSQNFALQGIAANVCDNLRPHFSHVAVKHTHDDSLVHVVALECAAFDFGHLCALALVHVGDSSTSTVPPPSPICPTASFCMARRILCSMNHAVFCVTFRSRATS